MFDVYLNAKRDRLLVIARGQPIPVVESAGRWRKKKGTLAVSDEIKSAVQRDGFYWRGLRRSNSLPSKKTTSPFLGYLLGTIAGVAEEPSCQGAQGDGFTMPFSKAF